MALMGRRSLINLMLRGIRGQRLVGLQRPTRDSCDFDPPYVNNPNQGISGL